MPKSEQDVINDLISRWISLGLEYAEGAQGVSTIYLYGGSEPNHQYANIFFEQEGQVLYRASCVVLTPMRIAFWACRST
jgi:hypothetical protein